VKVLGCITAVRTCRGAKEIPERLRSLGFLSRVWGIFTHTPRCQPSAAEPRQTYNRSSRIRNGSTQGRQVSCGTKSLCPRPSSGQNPDLSKRFILRHTYGCTIKL